MNCWSKVRLSQVLKIALDPCPVDPEASYPSMGIYGYARGAIRKPPIRGADIKAKTLYRVRKGQFIYSRLKAFEGAYTVVPDDMDGYFVSNEFPTFDCDPSRVLHRYIMWLFSSPDVWRDVAVGSKGMGARRERVHPDQFLAYEAPLPPIDEQRRIVAQLDKVAALVEERRQAVETAERETRALLLKAFERAIDGASYRPMAEVAPLVRRPVEVELERKYPELGVRSFGRGIFHKPDLIGSQLSWQKLFLVNQGDIVFSNIKAWEGAFAVAGASDHGRVGSHRYLTCVPVPGEATADFIWFYLQSHEGLGKIQGASPGSADRNRTLGQRALEAIEVPVPLLEIQKWFNRIRAKALEVQQIRKRSASDLDALLPALLYEIFNNVDLRARAA